MSWQDEFKTAVTQVLVRKGSIVAARSTYGTSAYDPADWHRYPDRHAKAIEWEAPQLAELQRRGREWNERVYGPKAVDVPTWCGGWASIADVHEERWSQFDGTDADNRQVGLLVATVTCRCGFITAERLEYEGSTGNLLRQVLDITDRPKVTWYPDDYSRDSKPSTST